jgi:hypothetical protein
MKMLFSSSTSIEVEVVRRRLLGAGIACEVRNDAGAESPFPIPFYPELWIENDKDFQHALTLYKRLGAKATTSLIEAEEEGSGFSIPPETEEPVACA